MADQNVGEPVSNPTESPGQDLSSLYVNRFNVLSGPLMTRIVFGETVLPPDSHWRVAVSMSTQDAQALADIINKVIKSNKERAAAAIAAASQASTETKQ